MAWFDKHTAPAPDPGPVSAPTYDEVMARAIAALEKANRLTSQLDRTEEQLHDARARIDELKQMIVRRDEAAQRPPLGYVVGYYSAHGWTFNRDYGGPEPMRSGAEQELAHEVEENPGVDFKLIELREVQP